MQLINAITVFKFEFKKLKKFVAICFDRYLVVHRFIESHKYRIRGQILSRKTGDAVKTSKVCKVLEAE